MATGRNDPERRERIITAALDLIAEEGVAGTSHRKVAARAGVPLGSMTYHFGGMDELLREAFIRFSSSIVAVFEERLGAADTPDEAREAVAGLVHHLSSGNQRELVLTHELYTLAARKPAYRELTREWMRRSLPRTGVALRPGDGPAAGRADRGPVHPPRPGNRAARPRTDRRGHRPHHARHGREFLTRTPRYPAPHPQIPCPAPPDPLAYTPPDQGAYQACVRNPDHGRP